MHTFGHPVEMAPLLALADEFNLAVVEDAAEGLGSFSDGKHVGTQGLVGCLSFNGNKIVTTGGGGALLFNNGELAAKAKHLSTTAKVPHSWDFVHDCIGFNYRMPNLNAALGCAQLEKLEEFLFAKRSLFQRYDDVFARISGIEIFQEYQGNRSNYWLQVALLDKPDMLLRDRLIESANHEGFGCRPVWRPINLLDPYSQCPRMDLPVTEDLWARIINLPSSAILGSSDA
jgi:perosamine synthetase